MHQSINLTALSAALLCGLLLGSNAHAQDEDGENAREQPVINQIRSTEDQQSALTSLYASKLVLANHCEIELARLAIQKTSNDDVQEFAEMLIQEHQGVGERLRSMVPVEFASMIPASANNRVADATDEDAIDDELDVEDGDEDMDLPRTGTSRTVVGRAIYDQASDPVIQKICSIEKTLANNRLTAARSALASLRGKAFDVGFVNMQVLAHENLLSELKALNDVGSPEFQKVVADTTKTITTHLTKARELAGSVAISDDDEEREDDFGDDENEDDGDDRR